MAYVERRGRVLRCVISTAENGCSLHPEAVAAAGAAIADPGPDVGAILLAGDGKNFCTGGNVGRFHAQQQADGPVRLLAGVLHEFLRTVLDSPLPVVAGVQGWAAGAGMSLVCALDVPIAGESTRLRAAYPGIGFSPDGGMTWLLPRLVGLGRARHLILGNVVLDAAEALAAGLVARVVPDGEVAAVAEETAAAFADGPTIAYGRIKALLRASAAGSTLDDQLAAEAESITASADGPEGREGVAAFIERRPPRFH
jgi:2-(1,2-epoxy-1,2-dihydrophenyl)acetyl-CoA isomerase